MIRNSFATRLLLVSMLGGGFDAIANAAEPVPPVALLSAGRGLLEWIPLVESEGMTLTLASPQGGVGAHHFPQGEAPTLPLFDTHGVPLPDGTYTWELRAIQRGTVPLVQSGYFTISGGNLVAPDLSEPPAEDLRVATAPDQIVPDDLIIDGKGCIGLGCVNNEAFGAEALRLKQSVVRLGFQDTSASGNFPTRDWQLTVNDSGSGGADRFSIEDLTAGTTPVTIRGGAPNNALFVDGQGKVGLGTATPAVSLEVKSGNAGLPVARLQNTNVSGFSGMEYLDQSGNIDLFLGIDNNASTTRLNSLNNNPIVMLTNGTERLRVASTGEVSIGTAGAAGTLHLVGVAGTDVFEGMGVDLSAGPAFNYGYSGFSFGRSSGFFNIRPDALAVAPNPSLRFMTSNIQRLIIDNEGFLGLGVVNPTSPIQHSSGAILTAGGTWQNGSSRAVKQDIAELAADEALTTLQGLAPVKFAYKVDPKERHVGFIAEDVPNLVASPDRKTLSPMDLVAVLTKVVQEQQSIIEELSAALRELRKRVDEIDTERP